MGCNSSKTDRPHTKNPDQRLPSRGSEIINPNQVNYWDKPQPLTVPYPQGQVDLERVLHDPALREGTLMDPNDEIVRERLVGVLVKV